MSKSSVVLIVIGAVLVIAAALSGYLIKGRFDKQDAMIASLQAGIKPQTVFIDSSQTVVVNDSSAAFIISNLENNLNSKLDNLKLLLADNNKEADSIISDLLSTIDSLKELSCNKQVGYDTLLHLGYWDYRIKGYFDCMFNSIRMDFEPLPETYDGPNFNLEKKYAIGAGGAVIHGHGYMAAHLKIRSFNIIPMYDFKKQWGVITTYTKSFDLF